LLWVAYSETPLTLVEIADAIVVEPRCNELDPDERLVDPTDILEMCGSLVMIAQETTGEQHVRLSHYSVKEYLASGRIRAGRLSGLVKSLKNAQKVITEVCLT
jgi:hypothetical protein